MLGDEEHVLRIEKIVEARASPGLLSSRRSSTTQRPRREVEQRARLDAVAFRRFTLLEGGTRRQAAGWLRLSDRTLRDWARRSREGLLLGAALRGRPLVRSSLQRRNSLLTILKTSGPSLGVAPLSDEFPDMPRREIADMLGRYRRAYVRKNPLLIHCLDWSVPGAVWAADFAKPPMPIDGEYPAVLSVRDLATGHQLLWLPVEDETARTTIRELDALFAASGAPLVFKSDNGSAFRAEATQALLERWGVSALRSPPRTPRYNGAAEAGIGTLKLLTHHRSVREGRSLRWTPEDLDAARSIANARRAACGPARREELWRSRRTIRLEERQSFARTVAEKRLELRADGAYDDEPDAQLETRIMRLSVERALVEHGFLHFKKRRIPLPIRSLMRAKIS